VCGGGGRFVWLWGVVLVAAREVQLSGVFRGGSGERKAVLALILFAAQHIHTPATPTHAPTQAPTHATPHAATHAATHSSPHATTQQDYGLLAGLEPLHLLPVSASTAVVHDTTRCCCGLIKLIAWLLPLV